MLLPNARRPNAANHVHDGQQNEHHAEDHREEPGDHLGKDEGDDCDDNVEHRRHERARVAVAHAALTEVRQQPRRAHQSQGHAEKHNDALHGNGRVDHQEKPERDAKHRLHHVVRSHNVQKLLHSCSSRSAPKRPYFGSDTPGHAPPSPATAPFGSLLLATC